MDNEEQTCFVADNTNSQSELIPENEKDNFNDNVKCSKDKTVNLLMEQVHRRQSLQSLHRNLLQKLAIHISKSSNKDRLTKVNYSDADECTFRELLEKIAAAEDKYHEASNKNLVLLKTAKEEISHKKESLMELKALFKETIEKVALSSVNSETGERFSTNEVKELLSREEAVSKTLEEYQLLSIEKRHNLNLALEKKKNLAEGPIDFAKYEMMCIETKNNKEIIQPIAEEIKNIMKKTSNIINILSHMGQKLSLAQKEKEKASITEKELEKELNEMRDLLFEEKMKYTKMKHESKELKHRFILLEHLRLIEDYNTMKKKNEEALKELQKLKTVYAEEMEIINEISK